MLRTCSIRQFSLLVPLQVKANLPAELQNSPLTDRYFNDLKAEYAKFNANCQVELQEMNQNVIYNIINRGGVNGWTTADNLDDLKRSFTFSSFEQAQAFCQEVAKVSNTIDHHPEWSLGDKGLTVNVRLTSHFAGNKVTRLDFQLAEAMNEAYSMT